MTATATLTMGAAPDLPNLTAGLERALGAGARGIRVVDRRANRHKSTFPSELLTCELTDGTELRLFVKYADRGVNHVHGHRSGVAFEARVYQEVLASLPLTVARFFGRYDEDPTAGGTTWLILEALDEFARVQKDPRPEAMPQAAEWIGRFHALNERHVGRFSGWVHRYDAAYFRGWCRRTAEYAPSGDGYRWLGEVCRRCEELLPELLARRPTLIHGEYYPQNILSCRGAIYPVDWESVAVAPGEIDLASLLEKWGACDVVRHCRAAYVKARWPDGPPADFERSLAAAQMYLHTRWLGNRRQLGEEHQWRIHSMRQLAEQLGLL